MPDRPQTLSPTLRERRRYIAYSVKSAEKLAQSDIAGAIWHSILNFLGELKTAESNVWLVRNVYDEKNQMGLIRCTHTAVENVRAALALVQRIGDIPVVVSVIGVSGTIKAARAKYFGEKNLMERQKSE